MLAIHGVWAQGALYLWAEESARSAALRPAGAAPARAQPTRTPARPTRTPAPHPHAAAPGLLADVLAELGDPLTDLARKAAESELTLWLPSGPAAPLASPELRGADPGAEANLAADGTGAGSARPAKAKLAGWQVPALSFDPAAALVLLGLIGQRGATGQGGGTGQAVVPARCHPARASPAGR